MNYTEPKFSARDLKRCYHQIRIGAENVHKIAFKSRLGHYDFLVIPFGLTNTLATFVMLMNVLLCPRKFKVDSIDSILVINWHNCVP